MTKISFLLCIISIALISGCSTTFPNSGEANTKQGMNLDGKKYCEQDSDCFCNCCSLTVDEKANTTLLNTQCTLFSKKDDKENNAALLDCGIDNCTEFKKQYNVKCMDNKCMWEKNPLSLTKKEVLKIAEKKIKKDGYSLDDFNEPAVTYDANKDEWNVYYPAGTTDTLAPPGGALNITIKDNTKEANLLIGE